MSRKFLRRLELAKQVADFEAHFVLSER
jgi:hypothetical protein